MKNIGKKLFALLLCVMLCCSLMPVYASPEDPVTYDGAALFSGSGLSGGDAVNGHGNNGLKVYAAGSDGIGEVCQYMVGWNQTATLKVKATGGAGSYKYQWYTVDPSGVSWDDEKYDWIFKKKEAISGATKSSYKIESFADDKLLYYACTVKDADGQYGSVFFMAAAYYYLGGGGLDFILYNSGSGVATDTLFGRTFKPGTHDIQMACPTGHVSDSNFELIYAEKFNIYRKEKGGKWKSLATVAGNPDVEMAYSYVDKKTEMGKTYVYKFRAYLNGKWTPFYETRTITFNPFEDVSLDDPSAEYIAWAYNHDVIKGSLKSDESWALRLFNPNDPCTRMNFVMILWKMHGKPTVSGSNPFSDVSGTTSVNAVKWAVKKKLVTGTSATTFSPDSNLSRINIIMILYKLAGSPKASAESQYEDISGSKTSKAVNWAVSKKIISPVDSTHFDPTGNCSRALLVEILCKYNEIYKIL